VKQLSSVDRRLARELGTALAMLGGRRDDPWIAALARVLEELTLPSEGAAGSKRRPGGKQTGKDPILELKPRV
jgi:hypothetical protein